MTGGQRSKRAASVARHLLKRGAAKLGGLSREDRGSVAILAGVVFPVVVGGMGLGVEAGYWYFTQRKLQHAADVSVHAAAIRKSQKDSLSQYGQVALRVAQEAGFNDSAGAIQVNSPPVEPSAFAGNPNAVQVILDESLPRLFTAIFTGDPLTLGARAVALVEQGATGCVLALSGNASSALKVSGSAKIELTACDVASNSVAPDAFNMQGGSMLTTGCVHTVGGASVTQNLTMSECDEVHEYAPKAHDPYGDVTEPEIQGVCENGNNFTPQGTLLWQR